MLIQSSATRNSSSALSHPGLWWGLLGVTAFSFTIVFTKVATGGLSPLFIGAGRAVVAAAIAVVALVLTRQTLPTVPAVDPAAPSWPQASWRDFRY